MRTKNTSASWYLSYSKKMKPSWWKKLKFKSYNQEEWKKKTFGYVELKNVKSLTINEDLLRVLSFFLTASDTIR